MIKKFYDFFKNILSESEETVSNPLIQYSSETKSLEEFNHKNDRTPFLRWYRCIR